MGKILKTGIIQQHNVASIDDNRARLAAKIRRLAADGAKLRIFIVRWQRNLMWL